jgi:hypothetical protein
VLRARPRQLTGRIGLSLLALVRMFSLLLGLQLSGAPHFVEDVLVLVTAEHVEHEQCPADGPCDDCPAGCPQCHCSNALRSVAASSADPIALGFDASLVAGHAPSEQAPIAPELPGLFRPPQADLAS